MNTKRLILGLGSVAAVLAIGSAALLNGFGIADRDEALYLTDGPSFADVADLTNASKAVAQVRVLSAGASYVIPLDNASTVVSARASDSGPKGQAGPQTSGIPGATNIDKGILKTDFTVEVLDNVHGAGLRKGDHIVVSQIGGTVTRSQPDGSRATVIAAKAEHDPLLQVGDEEILFLNQDPASGKFFTTGGGEGRFKVQPNGTVVAIDHESRLGRQFSGRPASVLKNAVQGI
jgi:hypothetical protein